GSSMLDEATAVAEAMLLARRAGKGADPVFYLDADTFTQTKAVLRTRAEAVGIEIREVDASTPPAELESCFGILLSYPAASGRILPRQTLQAWAQAAHDAGGQVVVAADLLSLTLLAEPAAWGADVVVGSAQRFGVPMGFGGPHAGYMAVRSGLKRQLPGRLVGVSKDADGQIAYRLALQTREQHIRRQKATSNICTAQVLLAVMASMYAVYHGPQGLQQIARHAHDQARTLATRLQHAGLEVVHEHFFDTLTVRLPAGAHAAQRAALAQNITVHLADADHWRISCDETTTGAHLDALVRALAPQNAAGSKAPGAHATDPDAVGTAPGQGSAVPTALQRTSEYLTHPVFTSHHSETQLMRYLRRLADKDYALDRGMIPLGSCTMKLNAAVEMAAVTWPEFAAIHPQAPAEDVRGYLSLIKDLQRQLAELTGYAAVSLQPNAGCQGELSCLLAIRRCHEDRG